MIGVGWSDLNDIKSVIVSTLKSQISASVLITLGRYRSNNKAECRWTSAGAGRALPFYLLPLIVSRGTVQLNQLPSLHPSLTPFPFMCPSSNLDGCHLPSLLPRNLCHSLSSFRDLVFYLITTPPNFLEGWPSPHWTLDIIHQITLPVLPV